MTEPQAFKGDYVDLKFIKTRKVAQVHIEIAIEEAAQFIAAFGAPNPSSGIPIAMARIDPNAVPERKGGKLAQRAGILCNEGAFWKFLNERYTREGDYVESINRAAIEVRKICEISSRLQLDHDEEAARKFKDLESSYKAWMIAAMDDVT
jgi:hypothetical protein